MRLLKLEEDNSFSLHSFPGDTPPYGILSHTWGKDGEEVTFEDISNSTGSEKAGYAKLRFCGKQANANKLDYFWVDTCCIDKRDLNELTEAINSMFRWYCNATRCYVYLSDVSTKKIKKDESLTDNWEAEFRTSRWFTRGWTLQELIAPKTVEFYSQDNVLLGDKTSLEQQIHEITGIAIAALRGDPLQYFSTQDRLRWVENRETTKDEDKVYCLLGIFNIHLPLIYGEGRTHALRRLHRIIEESEPQSFGMS
jgi:hypothetical protein